MCPVGFHVEFGVQLHTVITSRTHARSVAHVPDSSGSWAAGVDRLAQMVAQREAVPPPALGWSELSGFL